MKELDIARILVAKYEKTSTRNEEALLEEWMTISKANRVFVEKEYYARAEKNHLFTAVQNKIRDEFKKLIAAVYSQRAKDGAQLTEAHIGEIARLIVLELKKDILPIEKSALHYWINSDPNHKILYSLLDEKRIAGLLALFLTEQLEILTSQKRDLINRKYEELRSADQV